MLQEILGDRKLSLGGGGGGAGETTNRGPGPEKARGGEGARKETLTQTSRLPPQGARSSECQLKDMGITGTGGSPRLCKEPDGEAHEQGHRGVKLNAVQRPPENSSSTPSRRARAMTWAASDSPVNYVKPSSFPHGLPYDGKGPRKTSVLSVPVTSRCQQSWFHLEAKTLAPASVPAAGDGRPSPASLGLWLHHPQLHVSVL